MVERKEGKERWPTTTSVALQLYDRTFRTLYLVRKRDSQQYGLIAGGIEQGEQPNCAMFRELENETGLTEKDVGFLGTPKVFTVPQEEKTSIGLVFRTRVNAEIPKEGLAVESDEVDLLKPFSKRELWQLLKEEDKIYKPSFNIPAIEDWLRFSVDF